MHCDTDLNDPSRDLNWYRSDMSQLPQPLRLLPAALKSKWYIPAPTVDAFVSWQTRQVIRCFATQVSEQKYGLLYNKKDSGDHRKNLSVRPPKKFPILKSETENNFLFRERFQKQQKHDSISKNY